MLKYLILWLYSALTCSFLPGSAPAAPSQYDAAFYRTHDAIGNVSNQSYAANLPVFNAGPFVPPHLAGGGKRGTYSSYASSIVSQQELSHNGDTASIVSGSRGPPSIAFTQYDVINQSDGFYKGDDDFDVDTRSQAGFTEY